MTDETATATAVPMKSSTMNIATIFTIVSFFMIGRKEFGYIPLSLGYAEQFGIPLLGIPDLR